MTGDLRLPGILFSRGVLLCLLTGIMRGDPREGDLVTDLGLFAGRPLGLSPRALDDGELGADWIS